MERDPQWLTLKGKMNGPTHLTLTTDTANDDKWEFVGKASINSNGEIVRFAGICTNGDGMEFFFEFPPVINHS